MCLSLREQHAAAASFNLLPKPVATHTACVAVFRPDYAAGHPDNEVIGHEAPMTAVVGIGDVVANEIVIIVPEDIAPAEAVGNEDRIATEGTRFSSLVFHH